MSIKKSLTQASNFFVGKNLNIFYLGDMILSNSKLATISNRFDTSRYLFL